MSDTEGIQFYMLALAHKDDARTYERYLLSSAENGYIPAKLALADMYRETDVSKALKWYRELADLGIDHAMYRLGECYLSENDFKEGMRWLQKAAQAGNVDAMCLLHSRSSDDRDSMMKWFADYAQRMDFTNAWRIMNIMTDDDADASWTMMVRISEDNPQRMINEIDSCVELYLQDDPHLRFVWHMRCADIGDDGSMLEIGRMYRFGIGVEKSYDNAMTFYRKAAELDNYRAMYSIGRMYQIGTGVERSAEEARRWFSMIPAIDYPMAEYRIAEIDGVEDIFDELGTDFIDLLELFAKGNDAESQYYLAMFYHWLFSYDEMSIENMDKRAEKLYIRSARNGYPPAQVMVGRMHEIGSGNIKRSPENALQWYLKAAGMDEPEGMYRAALMYRDGKGTERSMEKAKELLLRASESPEYKEICTKELGSLHQ